MSEPEMSRTYEDGYLQALIDVKVYHEFELRGLKGDELEMRRAHEEAIEFLTGLIARKRERMMNEAIERDDPLT